MDVYEHPARHCWKANRSSHPVVPHVTDWMDEAASALPILLPGAKCKGSPTLSSLASSTRACPGLECRVFIRWAHPGSNRLSAISASCRAEASLPLCPVIHKKANQFSLRRAAVPIATWLAAREDFSRPICRATPALVPSTRFAKPSRIQTKGRREDRGDGYTERRTIFWNRPQ
jgi:hypothetical protein